MGEAGELRLQWRALAAASIGLGIGYTFINYVTNIFSPYLIEDLGWSRSELALLGLVVVFAILCQPVAGRLADRFGVRRVAMIGVVCAPLLFLALALLSGPFWQFAVINVLQVILVGGTTSAVVYTRLIAERFERARGIALGIAACAPSLAGAVLAPVMTTVVDSHGWRVGYAVVAAIVAAGGLAAMLLIPSNQRERERSARPSKVDYAALLRDPALRLIVAGVLLCNLTLTLQMTQIKVVLLDVGLTSATASLMISLYAGGNVAGRLLCGVALDRYPPHIVAAATMSAPAMGLFILASSAPPTTVAAAGVAVLGLAMGAEGDVGAYLVARYFPRPVYSSVFGIVMGALALSGAVGALLLSYTLATTGRFAPFLIGGGVAALAGGALFLLLDRRSPATVDAGETVIA